MKKNKPKDSGVIKTILLISRVGFVALFFSIFPSQNIYFEPVKETLGIEIFNEIPLPSPPAYPINKSGVPPPDLSADGIYVADVVSGVSLYKKNCTQRLSPASTTKLMTALVAMDTFKLDDILTVKNVMSEGKTMDLALGDQLTLESLLYGILVHSANDAAYVIADNYPGSREVFIASMNQKAKDLGLINSHFVNPSGFDHPDQYMTAEDLAKLSQVALRNKTIAKIVGTKSISVPNIQYTKYYSLQNVNELLGKVPGMIGVKTGLTDGAGEVLVSQIVRDGKSIVFVVLKSTDRFGETVALVNRVFDNFVWIPFEEIIPTIQGL